MRRVTVQLTAVCKSNTVNVEEGVNIQATEVVMLTFF